MKTFGTAKKIVYSTGLVFTITVFLFMAMFSVMEDNQAMTQTRAIPLSNYPWILLLSFIIGALNNFLTAKSISLAIRLPVHFVGVLAAFYAIILRVFGLGQNGRGRFSVMFVAAIIYAFVLLSAYIIRRAAASIEKKLTHTGANE